MIQRISASILILLSILFMPFWVSIILGLLGMFYFELFWEVIPLFLLSDLLYGVQEAKLSGVIFVSFILALVLLFTVEVLKRKLKFYS